MSARFIEPVGEKRRNARLAFYLFFARSLINSNLISAHALIN